MDEKYKPFPHDTFRYFGFDTLNFLKAKRHHKNYATLRFLFGGYVLFLQPNYNFYGLIRLAKFEDDDNVH